MPTFLYVFIQEIATHVLSYNNALYTRKACPWHSIPVSRCSCYQDSMPSEPKAKVQLRTPAPDFRFLIQNALSFLS